MRRTVSLLTTMAVALIVASGIALAQSQLDQQQPLDDGGYAVVNETSTTEIAQTFTAGVTGTLDKVSLDVGCCADDSGNIGGTPPGGGIVVWLSGVDSSGLPSGLKAFAEIPASDFSTDGTLHWEDTVTFIPVSSSGTYVVAGKQYAISVSVNHCHSAFATTACPPLSASGYQWGWTTPSAYSGGNALVFSGSGWQPKNDYDFAFKTYVTPDTTPPRVISTDPNNGATGVAPLAQVHATFSEDMMASTINGTTFKLYEKGANIPVKARVTYDADTKTARLNPTKELKPHTRYRAVVSVRAKDMAGNRLDQRPGVEGDQRKMWHFTVAN
jgi:hypothetical protein